MSDIADRLSWQAVVLADHAELFTRTITLLKEAADESRRLHEAINDKIKAEQHFDECVCVLCVAIGRAK